MLVGLQTDAPQDLLDLFKADRRVLFVRGHQLLDQPIKFNGNLVVVAAEDPSSEVTCLMKRLFLCQASAQEQTESGKATA